MRKLMLLFVCTLLFSCAEEEVVQNELDALLANLKGNEILAEKFDENGQSVSYEVIEYNESENFEGVDSSDENGRIQTIDGKYTYRMPALLWHANAGYASVVAGFDNTDVWIGNSWKARLDEGQRYKLYGTGKYNHTAGIAVKANKRVQVAVSRNYKYYERAVSVLPYEDCGQEYRGADLKDLSNPFTVIVPFFDNTKVWVYAQNGTTLRNYYTTDQGSPIYIQGALAGSHYGGRIKSDKRVAVYQFSGSKYWSKAVTLVPLDR